MSPPHYRPEDPLLALEMLAVYYVLDRRVGKTFAQIADEADIPIERVRVIMRDLQSADEARHHKHGRYRLTQHGNERKDERQLTMAMDNLLSAQWRETRIDQIAAQEQEREDAQQRIDEIPVVDNGIGEQTLSRTVSSEDADQLVQSGAPVKSSGVTYLSGIDEEGHSVERQLAGFAAVDEDTVLGQEILRRGQVAESIDNATRWTLVDHGQTAHIVMELVEGVDDAETHYAIVFSYPHDRNSLLAAANTGWLALHSGDPEYTVGAPQGRTKDEQNIYTATAEHGERMLVLTLSTHPQLSEMLRIMDKRSPTPRATWPEVVADMAYLQNDEPSWMDSWKVLGHTDRERLIAALTDNDRPLAAATGLFETMAMHSALDADEARTTVQIAHMLDMSEERASKILHGTFQNDTPWAWGRERPDGQWEWIKNVAAGDPPLPRRFEGEDLFTRAGRRQAAKALLEDSDIEIPLHEISPAMSLMESFMDTARFENAIGRLLGRPAPVWASARGFARAFEECRQRARVARQLGINRVDEITQMHVQLGMSMSESHVLVMDSVQVMALPDLILDDALSFVRETPLPFNPFFIDFTGDPLLPTLESELADDKKVRVLGCQCGSPPESEVLFVTPFFLYSSPTFSHQAISFGTLAINLSDSPTHKFTYLMGNEERFDGKAPALTLIARSDVLIDNEPLRNEYARIVELACGSALSSLYLLEASNVTMVPRPLERRDQRRAEKRNWNIPLVVRVDRPSKRVRSTNGVDYEGMGIEVEWTHQWEVIGHYKHYTRGAMVACIVCGGKTDEQLVCPRCNGTGLDPEKVSPCTRIDESTGEKTCPNGCRRVWCPPHWKGPEDKPMIPKARRLV